MCIDIKKSVKPVKYIKAIEYLEKKVDQISDGKSNDFVWILEHPSTYTAGKRFVRNEILDKKIKIIKTSRGGKITWHGPGQIVCYFVLDLRKRKKDIRKLVNLIEKTIIQTLQKYKIHSYSDRNNIGIWVNYKNSKKKIAAIGIRVKKWIAYHGFSINIDNDLEYYKKIMPCGLNCNDIINLKMLKKQNYKNIKEIIISKIIKNLKKKVS